MAQERKKNAGGVHCKVSKSGGAGGTASCRGYRGGAPNPCAAALSPQTSLRVRSTEDEDSPKGFRSPKPAAHRGAGRKALFAGNSGQLGVFRQTETPHPRRKARTGRSLIFKKLTPAGSRPDVKSDPDTPDPVPRSGRSSPRPGRSGSDGLRDEAWRPEAFRAKRRSAEADGRPAE